MTIRTVLAILVDYQTTAETTEVSIQLASSHPSLFHLKVIHLDNGNDPPVQLSPKQEKAGVELCSTGKNLGYAGGLNYAIQWATRIHPIAYDAFWFLNSDLEIPPHCLPQLISILNQHPRVGAVGPIVRQYDHRTKVWGARGVVSPWLGTTAMTDWSQGGILPKWSYIPGCSLLVRASAYYEVGKLPENYHLYFEETEFCICLQKAQWNLWVEPSATVFHKVYSKKAKLPAPHFAYYFTRNHLLFWKRCFGIPLWLQLPRTLYVIFREVLLPLRHAQNTTEAWDRIKTVCKGLIDGIRLARQEPK